MSFKSCTNCDASKPTADFHKRARASLAKGGLHIIENLRQMKTAIANEVRAPRTQQEHTIPVRDGLEVTA